MKKNFYVKLRVSQSDKDDYKVSFMRLETTDPTIVTPDELRDIEEGCVKMAQELTSHYRRQVLEGMDPGIL